MCAWGMGVRCGGWLAMGGGVVGDRGGWLAMGGGGSGVYVYV